MKILAIRGKNLASLAGEFEVDFTVEPLKNAGIFAITGSTGSGKSTLLDALCLALFDSTPRMTKARESKVELADVRNKTIAQSDSRSVLASRNSRGVCRSGLLGFDRRDISFYLDSLSCRRKAFGYLAQCRFSLDESFQKY